MKHLWAWIGRYTLRIWITVSKRDLARSSTVHLQHTETKPICTTWSMTSWLAKSKTSSPKSNMTLWCNKFGPDKPHHPILRQSITITFWREPKTSSTGILIRDLWWRLFWTRRRWSNRKSIWIRFTKKQSKDLLKRRTTGKCLQVDSKEQGSSGINTNSNSLIFKLKRKKAKR